MAKLDQVNNLMDVLEKRGEKIVLVVSAFEGVTNTLYKALDKLDGTDYQEGDIENAFQECRAKHDAVIEKFFKGLHAGQARESFRVSFDVLKQALMTHKQVSNVLRPIDSSFRIRDQVIGFGEHMAGQFLQIYLGQEGKKAHHYQDVQCDSESFGKGPVSNRSLHQAVKSGVKAAIDRDGNHDGAIQIFGGHVGGTPQGIVMHEGRGYSDITAVDVAAALQDRGDRVSATRFWKDVDGVYTANPKELDSSNNKPVLHRDISIDEALETAAAGSGLINVNALSRALQSGLDLQIRNIDKPDSDVGTNYTTGEVLTSHVFKTIVTQPHMDTVTIKIPEMADQHGFGAAIVDIFAKHEINLDGIFTAGTSITFSIPMPRDIADREADREKLRRVQDDLRELEVNGEKYVNHSIVWNKGKLAGLSIIGRELRDRVGVLSTISGVLSSYGINIVAVDQNELQTRINFLVDEQHRVAAVRLLHSIFVDRDKGVIQEYKARISGIVDAVTSTY